MGLGFSHDREEAVTRRMAAAWLLLLTTAAAGLAQTWQTGSLEEAIATAKKEKKLLLIDLYSPGG